MLVSIMKGSILENQLIAVGPLLLLALVIRFVVPRTLKAEKDWSRFAFGVTAFVAYTLMVLLTIWHITFGAVDIEDCFIRCCVGVVVVNLMVLFTATIFFFTRDRRPMSQEELMKLKDM